MMLVFSLFYLCALQPGIGYAQNLEPDGLNKPANQPGLKIDYEQYAYHQVPKRNEEIDSVQFYQVKEKLDLKVHFLVNDSMGMEYHSRANLPDPYRKPKDRILADLTRHHSRIYRYEIQRMYEVVAWPDIRKINLIDDSLTKRNWQFFDQTKRILDWECYPAISITENQDTLLVWFTGAIPFRNNAFALTGIPGIILEFQDQRYSRHFIATKVTSIPVDVRVPAQARVWTAEEWRKRKL